MAEQNLIAGITTVLAVAGASLLAFTVAMRLLFRSRLRGPTAEHLQRAARWPSRVTVLLLAVLVSLPALALTDRWARILGHSLRILLIVAVAWLLLRIVTVAERAAERRFDIEMKDNLEARRKRTQAIVLSRVASVLVAVVAAAGVLFTFEGARTVGASLLASAGAAGLIAGIAARSTLGNLIAGMQIAFTEPIRLDDVVVVEGEWGRVEEITLTYVVVKIWDNRRLILPTTYFVEQPFQNWTRSNAQVLGAVNLFVDHSTPVEEVRAELRRALESSKKWDGDAWVLQVIDTTDRAIELRALMTAEDAPTAWDLRCEIRERLVAFLQEHHPHALPRVRVAEATPASPRTVHPDPEGPGHDITELGPV
jgi:small-conductance mechanosensitive channel